MKAYIEYTDLFCGQANYSWCKRASLELSDNATDRQVVSKLKKEIGLNGIKCDKMLDCGGMLQYKVRGEYTTFFIIFTD
tara:strand:+ start:725 stop:961 length:237 start_codon:yes stop_codon:yes gene_type:complete